MNYRYFTTPSTELAITRKKSTCLLMKTLHGMSESVLLSHSLSRSLFPMGGAMSPPDNLLCMYVIYVCYMYMYFIYVCYMYMLYMYMLYMYVSVT